MPSFKGARVTNELWEGSLKSTLGDYNIFVGISKDIGWFLIITRKTHKITPTNELGLMCWN